MIESTERRKSVIRWAGSKRTALNDLVRLAPNDVKTYIEPFVGSAVLYFALQPERAVLSDLNPALINFYVWLKKNPKDLYKIANSIPRTKEKYLQIRSKFSMQDETIDGAAEFVFLNYNCFNGIFRTNKSGSFNVPFSGEKTPKFPNLDTFLEFSKRIASAKFVCSDFRKIITDNLSDHGFYYLDPPYFSTESRVFREYGPKYFCENDLLELSDLLFLIDKSGSKFMLSYADSNLANDLFKMWCIDRISLTRNVGGFAKSRKIANELVVRNY